MSGNLLAPLVDGGRRRAQVAVREAQQAEAAATYKAAVIEAFGEVEGALVSLRLAQEESATRAEALARSERVVQLTNVRSAAGLASGLDALDRALERHRAADAAEAARGAALTQWVALHKALGGEWIQKAP